MGIFFQQEADGSVYVKTIVSNGSAERDGVAQVIPTCTVWIRCVINTFFLQVGDLIVAVDDRQVNNVPDSWA